MKTVATSSNKRGQSTIEFLVTISFTFGMIMAFVQFSLNATNGYLAHYATFMASRAFLVHDQFDSTPQAEIVPSKREAELVFSRYNIFSKEGKLEFNTADDDVAPFNIGVWYEFSPLFAIGPVGGGARLKLRTESFLGKEPTRSECYQQVCAAIGEITGGGCEGLAHITLYDDGC